MESVFAIEGMCIARLNDYSSRCVAEILLLQLDCVYPTIKADIRSPDESCGITRGTISVRINGGKHPRAWDAPNVLGIATLVARKAGDGYREHGRRRPVIQIHNRAKGGMRGTPPLARLPSAEEDPGELAKEPAAEAETQPIPRVLERGVLDSLFTWRGGRRDKCLARHADKPRPPRLHIPSISRTETEQR